jgi:hypothetical protein
MSEDIGIAVDPSMLSWMQRHQGMEQKEKPWDLCLT